jgi:hypothetical protein
MSRITKRDTPTPADLDPARMSAAPALTDYATVLVLLSGISDAGGRHSLVSPLKSWMRRSFSA